jgi:microcystin-dependent protein
MESSQALFVGQIIRFVGNFAPEDWMFCDGTLLQIPEHISLFMILGTTYGGDGIRTFALPDLRDREPKLKDGSLPRSGPRYIICVEGNFPERPKGK